MTLNRFVFYGEWLDNLKHLPQETQDKIIAEMVRYGVGEEPVYTDDILVTTTVQFVKGAIDKSKNNYQDRINAGLKHGRSKKIDDNEVYRLAQEGLKSQEIADRLGVSKSTIDHNAGWLNRKKKL